MTTISLRRKLYRDVKSNACNGRVPRGGSFPSTKGNSSEGYAYPRLVRRSGFFSKDDVEVYIAKDECRAFVAGNPRGTYASCDFLEFGRIDRPSECLIGLLRFFNPFRYLCEGAANKLFEFHNDECFVTLQI